MLEPLDDALLVAIEAHAADIARGAGAIQRGYFGTSFEVQFKDKGQSDPVTQVDRECQEYLTGAIAQRFPDHGVLGEEDQEKEDSPAREFVWVVDPLDGTKNFVSGLPVYACSIGVLHQGAPVVGAVYVPWPCEGGGVVLHARRDGGAFMDQKRLAVLQSEEPRGNALVMLPGSFGAGYRFRRPMRGKVGEVRVTGSIAYELATAAMGVVQYTVTPRPRIWDVAGGVALVMEAGGTVMRGVHGRGLKALLNSSRWEPFDSFIPSWRSGATTMKELREWSAPLAFGSPQVVCYVTSNLRRRLLLKRRLARVARRLVQRRKAD